MLPNCSGRGLNESVRAVLFPHPHQILLCLWGPWAPKHPCLSHLHHLFCSPKLSPVGGWVTFLVSLEMTTLFLEILLTPVEGGNPPHSPFTMQVENPFPHSLVLFLGSWGV